MPDFVPPGATPPGEVDVIQLLLETFAEKVSEQSIEAGKSACWTTSSAPTPPPSCWWRPASNDRVAPTVIATTSIITPAVPVDAGARGGGDDYGGCRGVASAGQVCDR